MMKSPRSGARRAAWAWAVAGAVLVGPALAGPPMICFPFDNAGAKSLPWGKERREADPSYDRSKLVTDTLDLLKTESNTLARMETLRRAAIYCSLEPRLATELLGKLSWIALDAEANGKPTAAAWFNPGFFVAALTQTGVDVDFRAGVGEGVRGYAWIRKAISLEPQNADMHFAAALALFEGNDHARPLYNEHLKKAVAGAAPGSPLAKSMESNLALGGKKIEELRKESGVVDAGTR